MATVNAGQYDGKPDIKADFAIVFYKDQYGRTHDAATKHSIGKNNTLSLGRVISTNTIATKVAGLIHQKPNPDLIPDHVLMENESTLMWYAKRRIAPMWFRVGQKPIAYVVEWPPLLFVIDRYQGSMRVFGLANNSRPNVNTRLYHAPLMNIYKHAGVCQGTAHLPSELTVRTIPQCEATIYQSQFTHVGHTNTIKRTANKVKDKNASHLAFWRSRKVKKGKPVQRVTTKEMVFSGKRLSDILGEIA